MPLTAHRRIAVGPEPPLLLQHLHFLIPVQDVVGIVQCRRKVIFMLGMLVSQAKHKLFPTSAAFLLLARHIGMTGLPRKPVLSAKSARFSPWYRRAIPGYSVYLGGGYVSFQDLDIARRRGRGFGALGYEFGLKGGFVEECTAFI